MSFNDYVNPEGEWKCGSLEASLEGWERETFTSKQLKRIRANIKRLIEKAYETKKR